MLHKLSLSAAAALLIVSCGGSKNEPADNGDAAEPVVEEAAPEPAGDEGTTTAGDPDGKDEHTDQTGPTPVGDWVAKPCGERDYVRHIRFDGDGERQTYEGQDRVSPCPPEAQCVWSGIVTFNGRWWGSEDGVGLDELKADPADMGQPRPKALTWKDGQLMEGDCVYGKPEQP